MTNLNELIAELERLEKKATPGPWRAAEKAVLGPDIDGMVSVVWDERSWARGEHYSPTKTQAVANAKLATNLRNHLPQILTALRQARAAEGLAKALRELLVPVKFAGETMWGPAGHRFPGYEAIVPSEFVQIVEAALSAYEEVKK